jgi:hypothetical protein
MPNLFDIVIAILCILVLVRVFRQLPATIKHIHQNKTLVFGVLLKMLAIGWCLVVYRFFGVHRTNPLVWLPAVIMGIAGVYFYLQGGGRYDGEDSDGWWED